MSNFIPKPYKKENVSIRVEQDKLEKIDQLAYNYGISRSEFINQCVDFAMEHMPEFKKPNP